MAETVSDVTTMAEALLNTCIGMGTVFIVLILISFIIYLFKYIPALLGRGEKAEDRKVSVPAQPSPGKKEKLADSKAEVSDDRQLIAVIAAAIAAQMTEETGIPAAPDGLVIRSIKKRTLSK